MKKAMGLIAMLILGLALIGCDDGTITDVIQPGVEPLENISFAELIAQDGGALFAWENRSLRFYNTLDPNNRNFYAFYAGLFSAHLAQGNHGAQWQLVSETLQNGRWVGTIIIRNDANSNANPQEVGYTMHFEFWGQRFFHITDITAGTWNPTTAQIPRQLYSWGMAPIHRP